MLSDLVTSWLRTAVPVLWGTVIAWLVTTGLLPAEFVEQANGFVAVIIAVAIAVYYLIVRWAEPKLPDWLTRVLLGSAQPPNYSAPVREG